jgi:GGDEF domain-containing protein
MFEEIAAACKREKIANGTPVTATIGIAECPVDGLDVAELMRVADQRLYRGKAAGRNQFVAT